MRRKKYRALLLVLPLFLFIFITFILPIGSLLLNSFYHPTVANLIPQTTIELESWTPEQGTPNEEILKTFAIELQHLAKNRKSGKFAEDVNRFEPALGSVIKSTARKLRRADLNKVTNFYQYLQSMHQQWSNIKIYHAIKRASETFTAHYYITAIDKKVDAKNNIVNQPNERQIYMKVFFKTLKLALIITILTLVLGYPLAYYLSITRESLANILMILVLLPFWTSLLARTTSWIVLLQNGGVINQILLSIGIIDKPLNMLYNQYSTIIAMTHILLPFTILPLYSVMKGIDPSYMRAALSLGEDGFKSFWKVYFPMSLPGLSAGAILVFIVSVGYYITPALVGGVDGQMISNLIAFHMKSSNNWELAAALGSILLIVILLLYWLYDRLVGISNLKFGN